MVENGEAEIYDTMDGYGWRGFQTTPIPTDSYVRFQGAYLCCPCRR